MVYRRIVLAGTLLSVLAGCAVPASGPSPSASPAFRPEPDLASTLQAECERRGGAWLSRSASGPRIGWYPEMGYCEYEAGP